MATPFIPYSAAACVAADSEFPRIMQQFHFRYMRQPMNQVLTCLWLDQQPFPKTKPCGKQFTVMQDIVRHLNDEHVSRLDNNEYVCYWQNCTRSLLPFKAKYKLVRPVYFIASIKGISNKF